MRRYPSRQAPPWWPVGEPWPPEHRRRWRRGGRRFFLVRLAVLLVVVLALSVYGGVALLTVLFGQSSPGQFSGQFAWLIVLGFILLVFVLTMRRVGRPIGEVVAAAERVASGDFEVRLTEHGPPWLRSIAAAFNSMTLRLERQQRHRRDLMADVAHELRTPLAVMQGRLEGMVDGVYPRDERQVAQVLDETRTLARLVEDLSTLAHSESGTLSLHKETTDFSVFLDETLAAFQPEAESKGVLVRASVQAGLPAIDIDPLRMREVLMNLLSNAVRYSARGSAVLVEAAAGGDSVVVRVKDEGTGIPAEELTHIFDRFYKGRVSSGSGLGLAIARSLVAAHGGNIAAESRLGEGTTIIVSLPRLLHPA